MKQVLMTILASGLAGCASTAGSAGAPAAASAAPLSGELAASSRVDQVVLSSAPAGVGEPFSEAFAQAAKQALAACAKGAKPLRLEVRLTDVARGASGTARFIDPATGAMVGEYAVRVAAQAAGPAGRAFGDELCDRAFPSGPRVR